MALTLRGNGQITSDNYTIDSDGDVTAVNAAVSGTLGVTGTTSMAGNLNINAQSSKINAANNHLILHDTAEADTGTNWWYMYRGGGDGSLRFFKESDKLVINSDGHMTLPSQPYGEAEGTVGASTTIATNNVISWFAANHLNGGVTFSNGGRFTVPTTGRYLVHYRLYFYPNSPISQYYQISLQKNGTEAEFMIDEEVTSTYSGSGRLDRGLSLTTSIRLSANDYIELKYHGSATGEFYRGVTHNKFSVLLLG